VGNADEEGQERDDSLVHKSCKANEYLIKGTPASLPRLRLAEHPHRVHHILHALERAAAAEDVHSYLRGYSTKR